MRYIYQSHTEDSFGNILSAATVTVYLAGTTTLASIYTASSGGSAVNSVNSDSTTGYFSFYVDDTDYNPFQKFKVVISKADYDSQTYDNIDIIPYYPFVDVREYGAVGDGATDDTTAIQNAINAAKAAGGGIVFFPVGTYLISAQLEQDNNIILRGAGWGSIIKATTGFTSAAMIHDLGGDVVDSDPNMVIENLQLDGNSLAPNGVRWETADRGRIEHCYIHHCGTNDATSYAHILFSGRNVLIKNNLLTDGVIIDRGGAWSGSGIFYTNVKEHEGIIDGNIIETAYMGIRCDDVAKNMLIINNHVKTTTSSGIEVNGSDFATVSNNQIQNPGGNGIVVGNTVGHMVSGNRINGSPNAGIVVVKNTGPADHCVVSNNICRNNTTAGIQISSGLDIVITGNRCYDDQGTKTQVYGILSDGTSDYLVVVANNCRGNKTGNISLVGANNVNANNI